MNSGITVDPGLTVSVRSAGDVTIAELAGELDIASVPALREQLVGLLRPRSSQLVIDLSKVVFCDASGLAVLVGTARRARLLGGFLRLAAVSPPVSEALQITGLCRSLAVFPTTEAAVTGPLAAERGHAAAAGTVHPAGTRPGPAARLAQRPPAPTARELREAVAAVLTSADAWRDADPRRRFTPALRAMSRAWESTDDTALLTAARSLLSALSRHPLTPSPAVAATATRLRRVLSPATQPART